MSTFKLEKITIHSFFFMLAFLYCFGGNKISGLRDIPSYFVNGFYMTNYGMEGVDGYPNQLFSLFLYYGYLLTGKSFGLSYVLFLPIYYFGIFSIYKFFTYFIKNNITALFFALSLLSVNFVVRYAMNVHIYLAYFFMFVSIIHLCLFKHNIYIIAIYLAVATLFRNQLITFIPFLPFIINPNITKKEYFKTILHLVIVLAVVHFGFEVVRKILLVNQTVSKVNFNFYFAELKDNLFALPSLQLIKTAIICNLTNISFYYLIAHTFFLFNKRFYSKLDNPNKKLLKVFLIMALFIYFMPAIMYVNQIAIHGKIYYSFLLNRYSFIMFILLMPIYYTIINYLVSFIIAKYSFYRYTILISSVITIITFSPILRPLVYYKILVNSYNNFTINKNKFMFGANYKEIDNVIKNNFNQTDTILIDNYFFRAFFKPNQLFKTLDTKTTNYKFDGLMFINDEYHDLIELDNNKYKKIYEENADKTITIYKRID